MKLGSQHSLRGVVGFKEHSFPRNNEERCMKLTNSEEKNELSGNPGEITEKKWLLKWALKEAILSCG